MRLQRALEIKEKKALTKLDRKQKQERPIVVLFYKSLLLYVWDQNILLF